MKHVSSGYETAMTAPGQEHDEVITAQPGGTDHTDAPDPDPELEPRLDDVGDNHMPEDLRRSAREEAASERPQVRDSPTQGTDATDATPDAEPTDGAGSREVSDPDRIGSDGPDDDALSDPGRTGG